MKNFILSLVIITGFAACNNTPKEDSTRNIRLLTDSVSYNSNMYSDTSKRVAPEPVSTAKITPRVITRTRIVYAQPGKVTTPVNQSPATTPQVNTPPVVATVPTQTPVPSSTTDNTTVQTGNGTNTNTIPGTSTQPEKKKGWSTAAKGAAIGAGAGAIGGAILAKKKGLGAIVGGVVGAAGGYIIGKDIDKRNNKLIND